MTSKRLAAVFAVALTGMVLAPVFRAPRVSVMAQDQPAAVADLTAGAITVVARMAGDSMTVRIVAPSGAVVLDVRSRVEPIAWALPGDAEDGWYNYEAVIFGSPRAGIVGRAWGQFRVQGGAIVVPQPVEKPARPQQGARNDLGLGRVADVLLDWLAPTAHAQDLLSSSSLPSVFLDDTNDEDCSPSYDWRVTTSGGVSNSDINNYLQIVGVGEFESGGPCAQDIPIVVLNHDGLNGATSSSINSIVVPANGDVSLANGSVYVDRSVNRLGIGTTTPVQEVHIQNNSPHPLR